MKMFPIPGSALPFRWLVTGLALALLACSHVDSEQSLRRSGDALGAQLTLARDQAASDRQKQLVAEWLQRPLQQQDAVRVALINSPTVQAILARQQAMAAQIVQESRPANPLFSFESLTRADEREWGRLFSFGLLDLLTLPQRDRVATARLEVQQWQQTSELLEHIDAVRQAWVRAVAAQQGLSYARQVQAAAQASDELAQRMQAAGNWSKLQSAQQQAFHADAAGVVAAAEHASVASREALIRLLGLTEAQAAQLQWPDRLPDLPAQPRAPEELSRLANDQRIDVQLARAQWRAALAAQGLALPESLIDIELGLRRDTVMDGQGSTSRRGYEINVRLPIFDDGVLKREAMNASTLAATNQLEATLRAAASHLRESYSAYRHAYDRAQHHRKTIMPLRQTIARESLLRYNGMLLGVFDLLADSRDQMLSVLATIEAEQQFWLSDAALQSALLGQPQNVSIRRPADPGVSNRGH